MDRSSNKKKNGRRTISIAIVGADGSGKTSIAEAVLNSGVLPIKYLYMGPAIGSSRHALPTSRLIAYIRKRAVRELLNDSDQMPPDELKSEQMKSRLRRGRILKALGLMNRVAEEWYRQLIVWTYRFRGYSVICDRHYLFELCPDSRSAQSPDAILSQRIHDWLLSKLYPEPTIVVFLDAPAEVLHNRKPEWTPEYLNTQRERILEQGQTTRNFSAVDATQPFDAVLSDVMEIIAGAGRSGQAASIAG